jgi:hypothetical protein
MGTEPSGSLSQSRKDGQHQAGKDGLLPLQGKQLLVIEKGIGQKQQRHKDPAQGRYPQKSGGGQEQQAQKRCNQVLDRAPGQVSHGPEVVAVQPKA